MFVPSWYAELNCVKTVMTSIGGLQIWVLQIHGSLCAMASSKPRNLFQKLQWDKWTSVKEQLTNFTVVKHIDKPKNTNEYDRNNQTTTPHVLKTKNNQILKIIFKATTTKNLQQETREKDHQRKLAMTSNNLVCDVVLKLGGKTDFSLQILHTLNMTNWCLLSTCVFSLFAQMTRWMENQLSLPPPTAMLSGSKAGNCCASK